MPKKYDEDSIMNELKQGSVYFQGERTNTRTEEHKVGRTPEQANGSTPSKKKSPALSKEIAKPRKRIRHSFNIFEDQLSQLHLIQLQAVQAGKSKPTLSDMVQTAIDAYLNSTQKSNSKN